MRYEEDPGARPDATAARAWLCLLAVVAAIVGLALAFRVEPMDLPPGCRMVGKFRQCDPTPSPSPSTSDPLSEYDDGVGDGIGGGIGGGIGDGDGLDDGGGLDDNPYSDL